MLRRQRNTRETLFITSFPPLQKASWNGLSSPKPPSIHAGAGSPPYSGSHKCVVTSTAGKPSSFFRIIACPPRGFSFVCAACKGADCQVWSRPKVWRRDSCQIWTLDKATSNTWNYERARRVSNSLNKHDHFSSPAFCPSTSFSFFFRLEVHFQPLFVPR